MRSGTGAHLTVARGPQDGRAHAGLGPCGDLSPVPFPLGPCWARPGRAVLPRAGLCRRPPHMEPRESWAALAVTCPIQLGQNSIISTFPSTAAAFFITYENVKSVLPHGSASYLTPVTHMVAASFGEVVACLIRVPSEVVKQRAQVSPSASTFRILSHTLYHEGIQGLYRGYKSTVLREIPFSLVQFPLWEALKDLWSWKQGHVVDSWQSAVCGAFAGGFAAAVTTPLDVAKTRIMLAKAGSATASGNVLAALGGIWRTQGLSGLFAGVVPRMAAISLGGFIFLGTYEKTRELLL
uniref:Mitochondrial S-adenosylmethionine carrier protein n=1 Tax=Anas platyrhynchos platyrhynchos TaxID=8840 RepID=A0A493TPC6_ANAPP